MKRIGQIFGLGALLVIIAGCGYGEAGTQRSEWKPFKKALPRPVDMRPLRDVVSQDSAVLESGPVGFTSWTRPHMVRAGEARYESQRPTPVAKKKT